jgi:WD40 repeat protein
VLDLGLVRAALADAASTALTASGVVVGTPDYLAPEQITDARDAVARADLYSLGCTLYHLLAGRPPFNGATVGQKLVQHQSQDPPPLAALRPEVGPEVERLVRRLMAKDAACRPATAAEVAADLAALLEDGQVGPPAAQAVRGGARGIDRRRVLIGAGTLALVAAGGGLGWWLTRSPRRREGQQPPPLSTLDQLSRESIPDADRLGWQPEQVVGVLGEQRGRHWSWVCCLAVSPDAKLAASGGGDHHVRLWDLDPSRPADLLRERLALRLASEPKAVGFSADGRTLITAQEPGRGPLQRWDAATGKLLVALDGPGGDVVSPGGKLVLFSLSTDEPRLYDASTGEVLWREGAGRKSGLPLCCSGAAFLPDESGFFLAGEDHVIVLRDLKGKPRQRFVGHKGFVGSLSCSRDGRRLLSAGHDSTVRLWDVSSGKLVASQETPRQPSAVLSPDGGRAVLFGDGGYGAVSLLRGGDLRRIEDVPDAVPWRSYGAFTPSGERLVLGSRGGVVEAWQVAPLSPLGKPIQPAALSCVAVSGDGRRAFVGGPLGDRGRLWSLPSCSRLAAVPSGSFAVSGAAFSPDPEGRLLLVNQDNVARLYDGSTLKRVREFEHFGGFPILDRAIAFHPSGQWVAGGGGPPAAGADLRAWSVRLWDVDSGGMVREFVGHEAPIVAVSFSADGERLLTAASAVGDGRDRTLRLWDVESGRQRRKLTADFPAMIRCAALSPDGKAVACGTQGAVYVWDLEGGSGRPAVHEGHKGDLVNGLAWLDDGRFVSADQGGRVLVSERGGRVVGACRLPGPVNDVKAAADGRHVLTANNNGTVYVLRLPLSPPAG